MVVITRIKLNGFRGSNNEIEIDLQKSTIIKGPSGSGKTTILHAIEWALFGKIFGFKGPGFSDEDAYVNIFTSDSVARVELDFRLPDGTQYFIQRFRKKYKKSTVGTTELILTVNGIKHTKKEAQNLIDSTLKLNHDQFTQAVFLHQETLRKFIEGKPADRSEIIDQLLGTKNLREFIANLDPKRKIQNQIKSQKEIRDGLEEQVTSVHIDTQDRLDQERTNLLNLGNKESQLNIEYIINQNTSLKTKISYLSQEYGISSSQENDYQIEINKISGLPSTIESSLIQLERARGQTISENKELQIKLQGQLNQYIKLRDQFHEEKSNEMFVGEINKINDQNTSLLKTKDETSSLVSKIEPYLGDYTHLSRLYEDRSNDLKKIIDEVGKHDLIVETKNKNSEIITRLNDEINQENDLTKLISLAHSHISEYQFELCPVCKQTIDPIDILSQLIKEIKKNSHKIQQNKKTLKQLEADNETYTSVLKKMDSLTRENEKLIKDMSDKLGFIRNIMMIEDISIKNALNIIDEKRMKMNQIDEDILNNRLIIGQLTQEKNKLQNNQASLNTLVQGLELSVPTEYHSDNIIESVKNYLNHLNRIIEELERTDPMDSLHLILSRIKPIIVYLSNVHEFEKKFDEKTVIERRIEKIDHKIDEFEDLETSLQIIREVLSEHQSSIIMKSMEQLQESIDYYYNMLNAHPYFKKIKITSLPTEPVTYDILACDESDAHETHINTRFSTAQINVAALAIFFTLNKKMVDNFPLLLLDDPTQNMGPIYQDALVNALNELTKNRQLIIATHEELFSQKLANGSDSNIAVIKMKKWTTDGLKPT